ncbi:hypothetical protein L228DRAFT_244490 [Xylona heveae TC161]|uniref:SWR1-complex protein 4 n=1 Tax=Xylona heveae (strain CBS 132557 / TC161) TaxID=1328760 RepID=A0A165J0C0_XYLHT|nr:hypothetical protein L228DRAFT_244490 [Xylona heveae TC161]KZF25615.1 hypothetical protein L228DRAFT_244490 [Xylona heveae TC161]
MSSADVRDMLDLPADGGLPRPAKKQKTVEKRPEGITRELFALLGERAPPVAITDHVKFKDRPKRSHRAQPWEWTPFTNPARTDGLVLHHWRKRKESPAQPTTGNATADGAGEAPQDEQAATGPKTETDYYYSKFNVKVNGPDYTDEQYHMYLRSDEWSKEETDYLVNLCIEYDLRWIVIADRYDFQPVTKEEQKDGEASALIPAPKKRTMEDMKLRYYEVAAKMLAIHRPINTMSTAEFELHETMSKFNAVQETQRKQLANALLSRSPEEIKEEEILLGELRRIVSREERLLAERKELFARLESPQSNGNTQQYQSSQGLGQLMQTLLAADKNKKRRTLVGPSESGTSPATGTAANTPSGQKEGREGGRDSVSGTASTVNKKGAAAAAAAAAAVSTPPERKPLTKLEEIRYGVSHHDRLTSGVQFRHDRVNKLGQAKSNAQAAKIAGALNELQIPPRLVMPTAAVCGEYERLIQNIHTLLDVRKLSEKIEAEIKVANAQKEERERKERAERGEPEPPPAAEAPAAPTAASEKSAAPPSSANEASEPVPKTEDTDTSAIAAAPEAPASATEPAQAPAQAPAPTGSGGAGPADQDKKADENPEDAGGAGTGGHKRSASVMSAGSNKSSKRQKR